MVPGIGGSGDTLVWLFDVGTYTLTSLDSNSNPVTSTSTVALAGYIDTNDYEFGMAGTCTFNGTSIPQSDVSDSYWADSVTIDLDGSMNVLSVSGSASIAAFSDSVGSPVGATSIPSPGIGDTASKENNLTVTWDAGGADTVHIYVIGTDTNGTGSKRLDFTVPDNGSHTVNASDPGVFGSGQDLAIAVSRVRFKSLPRSGGRQYILLAHSDHMIFCPLVD